MHILDILAISWFILCWLGYNFFTYNKKMPQHNLVKAMYHERIEWMKALNRSIEKSDRLVDMHVIFTLMRSTTFFASNSILIIAGLIGMLGYYENISPIYKIIPMTTKITLEAWYIRVSLLIIIFVHSFFKYTWALRQYNYATILCASTPLFDKETDESAAYAHRNAKILTNASRHFTLGMRSYYFGLSALAWFVSPILFMICASMVLFILYRREFMSRALNAISFDVSSHSEQDLTHNINNSKK